MHRRPGAVCRERCDPLGATFQIPGRARVSAALFLFMSRTKNTFVGSLESRHSDDSELPTIICGDDTPGAVCPGPHLCNTICEVLKDEPGCVAKFIR
ncbi:hypothetical protein J6590_024946 [Homalodisca vitripennis]|nr:hypothetical protein J6590_024946 [Homalodisca vitripennis]